MLWEEGAYGEDLAYQYRVELDAMNAQVVYQWSYSRERADFRVPVNELKGVDADIIFFAGLEPWAGDFVRMARGVGVKTPILGAFSDTPEMRDRAGPGLEGAMYFDLYNVDSPSPENQAFVRKFRKRYARNPDTWAAQGYDALRILAKAVRFTGSGNPLDLSYAIRFMDPWEGANGRYKFDGRGELEDKPHFPQVFRNGTPVTIQESHPVSAAADPMRHAELWIVYPLSFPQQSIYLDALLRGVTTKYNMGGAIVIRGPLDATRFRQALEYALGVHDVQRMRLHPDSGTAMQEFLPAELCALPYQALDFSNCPQPLASAMDWLLADFRRPMRLDQFPLHGDVLFRLGDDLHLWYPKFHHLAYDAYGHSLIAATVAESYNELLRRGYLPDFERRSYADFIQDDRAYAASEQFRKDEAFWRAKFPAMPQPLPFTTRKGELTGDFLATERHALGVNRQVYDSLAKRSKDAGVTLFHILLACLAAYLNRIAGCDELVAGTPILNRGNHAFRRTAGMFMNMMPLRIQVDRGASVLALAGRIKAETRSCYRHQRFPLGEILRHCRSLDGFCHGVFDVTVVYRKLDYGATFGGSPIMHITLDTGRARGDPFARDRRI